MFIIAILVVTLTSTLVQGKLFQCYYCTDCPVPFRASDPRVSISSGCSHCLRDSTYQAGEITAQSMSCVGGCAPYDQVYSGTGAKRECCEGDLCNGNTGGPEPPVTITTKAPTPPTTPTTKATTQPTTSTTKAATQPTTPTTKAATKPTTLTTEEATKPTTSTTEESTKPTTTTTKATTPGGPMRCYACNPCPIPFDASASSVRVEKPCGSCLTDEVFANGAVTSSMRMCLGSQCTGHDMVVGGSGARRSCCNTPLCNGADGGPAPVIPSTTTTTRSPLPGGNVTPNKPQTPIPPTGVITLPMVC